MKLQLDIGTDLTPVFTAFGQTDNLINQTSDSAKKFGKDASQAYKNATTEVDKFGKEVVNGTKQVSQLSKHTSTVGKSADTIRALRQEMNQYVAIAHKAGEGTKEWKEALDKAGETKEKIKDLQVLLNGIADNQMQKLTRALGTATQVGIQGFEGVIAAQSLFGIKNDEVEKQLLKLQSLQALSNLAGEFSELGKKATQFRVAFEPVTDLYTKANSALTNFSLKGKLNFKSLVEGGKNLFSSIGSGIANFVKSGVAGIKTLGATLAANPLGIILIVIAAVITAMILLKDKVKPIGEIFKALGEIVDAVGSAIKRLGQAIGIVASDFEEGLKKQIDGTKKVVDAIGNRYDFEIAKAQAAGKETGDLEIAKARAQASAINQQIANLYALAKIQGSLNEEQRKQLDEAFAERKKLVQEAVVLTIQAAHEKQKKEEEANKKAQEEAKKNAEKMKQLRKELSDALLDLDKRAEKAELDQLNGSAKILKQRDITNREIDLLKESIEKKGKLVDKNFKFTLEQEGEFNKLRLANEYQAAQQLLQFEVDKANAIAAQHKKEADDELAFIELKEKISLAKVGSAKNESKLPEAEFEKLKERVIAQIKMKAAKDTLALKQKQIDAEAAQQITAIEGEIKTLKAKGDSESLLKADQAAKSIDAIKTRVQLESQLLQATTDEEIKTLQDQINNIDKGLKKPKGFSLGKMFGLDDETMGKLEGSINQTIDSLKQLSDDYFAFQQENLDKELKANDDRIQSRNDNIDNLKQKLAEETALQEQGLANNVDRVKQEIAAQNAAKDADIAKSKQVHAEKKKLAKQQLIIDTALQASQMVLAIAQLFAQGSSFWVGPVPVGLIVAGLSAVAMVASFIVGKKRAFDAVNSDAAAFKTGGYTGDKGVDEEAGVVHGKEFVHTAEDTKSYRNLFEGIHKKRKPLIAKGLMELLQGTGVSLSDSQDRDLPMRLSSKKDSVRQANFNAYLSNDNKGVEERIERVEGGINTLIKQNKNKTTILADGTVIKEFGNITRTIKKR